MFASLRLPRDLRVAKVAFTCLNPIVDDKEITAGTDSLIKQINDYGARTTDAEESKALDEAKLGIVSFVTKIRQVSSLAAMGEAQLALAAIQREIGPLHLRLSAAFSYWLERNRPEESEES